MEKVWIDVEVTGVGAQDGIREIAVLYGKKHKMWRVARSGAPFPGSLPKRIVIRRIEKMLKIKGLPPPAPLYVFAGYNVAYDIRLLKRDFWPEWNTFWVWFSPQYFDVLVELRKRKALFPGVENFKLKTVAEYLALPLKAHGAMSDTRICRLVWKKVENLQKER